jgi:dTDP-4-dehydrorhamnose 3,5-epimerase
LDYWIVLDGHAFVALVDIRPIATGGSPVVETRELGTDDTVTIPVGVAHGFLALTQLVLLYIVTSEYDGSDEFGFRWNDPWAAVPWPRVPTTPDGMPILSERDRGNPELTTLSDALRRG